MRHAASSIATTLVLAFTLAFAGSALGQGAFPNKPVRIIIGYAAGGGNDILVRIVAAKMAEGLGQPVVIENRPGAQSIIAAEYVAKSPPDGYTLLTGPSGPITMNPALHAKLPYAPLRDFAPISMIGSFPLVLVVNPALPARSVKELIELAKSLPDQGNYGASAAPFQLATELFKQKTGTRFTYIPYKGSNESVGAVMAGQVTLTISDPAPVSGPLAGGKVRALAVTSARRVPAWPDVPTMTEAGIPDMEITIWTGLLAPAGTPPAIVRRLQEEVARAVKLPDVRERFATMAIDSVGNTPEEFGKIIASEIEKWSAVAKAANIKAE